MTGAEEGSTVNEALPAAALPPALALTAGVVDVTTFVLLDGFFSAHVTGNLVSLAASVTLGKPVDVASVVSIPLFVAVTAVLAALATRSNASAWTWTRRLLGVQLTFVLAAGILSMTTDPARATAAGALAGLLAVAGMAAQNALLHLTFDRAPTTAVMTGNLVAATVALVRGLTGRRPDPTDRTTWRRTWPLIAGFSVGCLAGAAACATLGSKAWVLPILLCSITSAACGLRSAPPEMIDKDLRARQEAA